ncbi:MAG: Na+/H+ antiporter NhaA [Ferruginibacter sp.]
MKLSVLFKEFFNSEKAGGLLLIATTLVSLVLANSSFADGYQALLNAKIASQSITHLINDGLMAIFFLLIGLELEREVYEGELASLKNAALPLAGALGGMVLPAGIFIFFNYGTATQSGAGIPMATDIAFALGILSLLGKRVPASLKIFLTALAVIDDLCAIIIIAVFYTKTIAWIFLIVALSLWVFLFALNRLRVFNLIPYIIGGIGLWYCMLNSGVHATIAGVMVAFAIPFGTGGANSPSYILQHFLHKPVAFIILPLFALANTAIAIGANPQAVATEPYSLGIFLGLVFGKGFGIFLFCLLAIAAGICTLPTEIKKIHILGTSFLGGIGFTMSIFITMLAFEDSTVINNSKLIILVSSIIAGLIGFAILKLTLKTDAVDE